MKQIIGVVDGAAVSYLLSYKCLIEKHIEVSNYHKENISAYLIPAITTAAFSCEIALKNIGQSENGIILKGHDLLKLFISLSENTRKDIMNRTINAFNSKSELFAVADRMHEKDFYKLLETHKNIFITWRYFYENTCSMDLDFIEALLFCLNGLDDDYVAYVMRIKEMKEEVKNK